MNGYYDPPDAPQSNWQDTLYSLFLVAVLIAVFYWMWQAHKNSPCQQDPVPQQYETQCKTGFK